MIKKIFKILFAILLSIIILIAFFNILVPIYFYLKKDIKKLYLAIDNANKIIVTRYNDDDKMIYYSDNNFDIKSFRKSLKVEKNIEYSFPACRGELGINLYKDKKRIARIAYLSNNHIRVDDIEEVGYISITDNKLLEKWFHDRNISIHAPQNLN